MIQQEISAADEFFRFLRRWWLVALLAVLGGCLGWIFHSMRPPVYEAVATFSVVINLPENVPPLDEREQDQAIGVFKALLTATSVIEKVRSEAHARGIPAEALALNHRVFTERRQAQIDLVVRHENAETAALIANLWAEQAYAVMVEAYGHALKAYTLGQYQQSLFQCVQTQSPAPAGLCALESLDALEKRLHEVDTERQAELLASQALLPTLKFEFVQRAEPPQEPIAYTATALLLAGTLIGCVAGVVLALLPWPDRKAR